MVDRLPHSHRGGSDVQTGHRFDRGGVKTLAIRLEPDVHAQLSLIAQLRGRTITDEIRAALEAHIGAVKASPELAARADSVLEDIERDSRPASCYRHPLRRGDCSDPEVGTQLVGIASAAGGGQRSATSNLPVAAGRGSNDSFDGLPSRRSPLPALTRKASLA